MKNSDMPAMPVPLNHGETFAECGPADGLTKREMMAMAAMQGIASKYTDDYRHSEIARLSVQLADALLAELENKGGDRWRNAPELPSQMTREQFADQYLCDPSAPDAHEDQNKEGGEA